MSRIGKLPVNLPAGVEANLLQDKLTITGPKGSLVLAIPDHVQLQLTPDAVSVTISDTSDQFQYALWGTIQRLISNMVQGVTAGFTKRLKMSGVGYRAAIQEKSLNLELGFSHPVKYPIPDNTTITVENNVITITGIDKQLVGQTAAEIRSYKKPEPYKGKGIMYDNEIIRRKAGKQAAGSGGK